MKFYELTVGMIFCDECLENWRKDTTLVGDEAFDPDYVVGLAETPCQCDSCLTQSDDYDSVMEGD